MNRFVPVFFVGFVAAGCGGSKAASPAAKSPATTAKSSSAPTSADRAIAELLPTAAGGQTRGMVALHMESGVLVITARMQNLKAGSYGFAVHEGTKCEPPDGKSAGAIFNPNNAAKPSGFIGDLASKGGDNQTLKITAEGFSMSGPDSIIGHTLVLHAWPYDPSVDIKKVPFLACGTIRADTE
jgi:Cu-Zn family superoxide dismutase